MRGTVPSPQLRAKGPKVPTGVTPPRAFHDVPTAPRSTKLLPGTTLAPLRPSATSFDACDDVLSSSSSVSYENGLFSVGCLFLFEEPTFALALLVLFVDTARSRPVYSDWP